MRLRRDRYGLRVTVRLHGLVVGQAVHWPRREAVDVGVSVADAVPTSSGRPWARASWASPAEVRVMPGEDGGPQGVLRPGDALAWRNGEGVEAALDLVPRIPARRRSSGGGGDVALLTMVLLLTVGVAQARMVLERLFPDAGAGEVFVHEPTPELIARLLRDELAGAEEGLPERVERPEHEGKGGSFYMPAGNDGPLDRAGGGAVAGGEVVRGEAEQEEPAPGEVAIAAPLDGSPAPPEVPGTPAEADPLVADAETGEAGETAATDPVERFVGWGFRDWFEVRDARLETESEIARHLELARARLAVDPDDPAAIQVIGYYAYLAENFALGERIYERYTRLFPDDPAGFNNLALVFKRTGDYAHEEALYRQALAIDPMDTHVLNNLAVNLAHQGRYDEALRAMDVVDELQPGDPYAALHRAKVFALMGRRDAAYRWLERALAGVGRLDTLHHIEFRQDIRLDPAFAEIRAERRFKRLVRETWGRDADYLLEGKHAVRTARRWSGDG